MNTQQLTSTAKDLVGNGTTALAATLSCFLRVVPTSVPRIVFLSGGQPAEASSARLSAMHALTRATPPWILTFSFARAIQQPALEIWKGIPTHVPAAQ